MRYRYDPVAQGRPPGVPGCTQEQHKALSGLSEPEFRARMANVQPWPEEMAEELGYGLLQGECPRCRSSLNIRVEVGS